VIQGHIVGKWNMDTTGQQDLYLILRTGTLDMALMLASGKFQAPAPQVERSDSSAKTIPAPKSA
jgi:hypothetical protein